MDREEFVVRYLRFDRMHRLFIGLALVPFFVYFVWFLFSGLLDGFMLELSWRAAVASIIMLALCFGGVFAGIASVPLALRLNGLVCPGCGSTSGWQIVNHHVALRTRCRTCNRQVFSDTWPSVVSSDQHVQNE